MANEPRRPRAGPIGTGNSGGDVRDYGTSASRVNEETCARDQSTLLERQKCSHVDAPVDTHLDSDTRTLLRREA